jgi:hypothetical protein
LCQWNWPCITPSTSLRENLDTTTPGGRLVFHVFAALAEFIRELIVQGTREGLATARAHGRIGGRPTVVNDDLLRAARDMLSNPQHSITSPSCATCAQPAANSPTADDPRHSPAPTGTRHRAPLAARSLRRPRRSPPRP